MKLLMIVADTALDEEIRAILHAEGLSGYSEIPDVLGSGTTGEKRGSRAFPGANNMYLTVASTTQIERIVNTLRIVSSEHEPHDAIRAFTINADQEL